MSNEPQIAIDNVAHVYRPPRGRPVLALEEISLQVRPREFVANAQDVSELKQAVTRQSPRYAEIAAPTVIIAGDRDTIVSTEIHAKALAVTLPRAKLIVLPGVGHAVQHVAAELAASEIDRLAGAAAP